MSRHALRSASFLIMLLAAVFSVSTAGISDAAATPRQPSISQKHQNHKAECAEYGDSFESGTYTDADTGAVTNYSVCFSGDSMVICEWTATTDFCLGAFPESIQDRDTGLPPIDEVIPAPPSVDPQPRSNARD